MLLLVVFICMGALVQGSLLQDFILKEDADKEERLWVWNRYGTAYRSLYTMYEITFVTCLTFPFLSVQVIHLQCRAFMLATQIN